jgi:hypothetical protein
VLVAASFCLAQDVPPGVNYRKATPEVNAKAKTALEQSLAGGPAQAGFLSGVVSCGPMLWNDLKPAQDSLEKDSTPKAVFLSLPEQVQTAGRAFRSQEQRDRFWKTLLAQYPDLRKGTVRPAKKDEIQFYWAAISFDIDEPLFAVETPANVFIVNVRMEDDNPRLFWIDRVDDLHKLKKTEAPAAAN